MLGIYVCTHVAKLNNQEQDTEMRSWMLECLGAQQEPSERALTEVVPRAHPMKDQAL